MENAASRKAKDSQKQQETLQLPEDSATSFLGQSSGKEVAFMEQFLLNVLAGVVVALIVRWFLRE